MIAEAELGLRAQSITQGSHDAMIGYDVQSFIAHVHAQVQSALTVAAVLGNAAAGSLNALGTSTQQATQLVGSATQA
jgi:hypothetical protein